MKRTIKNVLLLILLIVLLLVGGYFLYSYNYLSDKHVPVSAFDNAIFETQDKINVLAFGKDNENMKIFEGDISINLINFEYGDNIIKMTSNNSEYYFIVIDSDTLYSKQYNDYFYRIKR